jgi:hypothetical protein
MTHLIRLSKKNFRELGNILKWFMVYWVSCFFTSLSLGTIEVSSHTPTHTHTRMETIRLISPFVIQNTHNPKPQKHNLTYVLKFKITFFQIEKFWTNFVSVLTIQWKNNEGIGIQVWYIWYFVRIFLNTTMYHT